jgi:hypothetical protein
MQDRETAEIVLNAVLEDLAPRRLLSGIDDDVMRDELRPELLEVIRKALASPLSAPPQEPTPEPETQLHVCPCGAPINAGEAKTFGCCDTCWDLAHPKAQEPETCEWREQGALAHAGCGKFNQWSADVKRWKVCPHCTLPLRLVPSEETPMASTTCDAWRKRL